MSDNGESLKSLVENHQNLLVTEGIIRDTTARSLQTAFSDIASGKLHDMPSKSFIKQWHEIFGPEKNELNNCQKELVRKSREYEALKYLTFTNVLVKVFTKNQGLERKKIAAIINDILDTQDYGMEYYKMSIFFVFDLIPTSAGADYTTTTLKNPTKKQKRNALGIEIDFESKILVENNQVDLDTLGDILENYFKENKSESVLSLRTDNNAKYSIYANVSELILKEINQLRKELAESEFQKSFEELNQSEMDFVNSTYPLILIE